MIKAKTLEKHDKENKNKNSLTDSDISSEDDNKYKMKIKHATWETIAQHVKTRNWRQCLMRWYENLKMIFGGTRIPWTRPELLAFLKLYDISLLTIIF